MAFLPFTFTNPIIDSNCGIFVLLFVIIGFLIYYNTHSTKFNKNYSIYFTAIFYLIGILIVIVALALTYKIFENNLRNQTGIIGFLIDLIFYLPCLSIEFIKYLGNEINMTPNVVFVLFIIEIFEFWCSNLRESIKNVNPK